MLRNIPMTMLTLVAGGSLVATAANAHPKLVTTNPAANAVITSSPKELRFNFNEDLVPKFSGAEVKDQKGQKIKIGTAMADPADKKQLVVPLPTPLAQGVYKVVWHAVAADTHRVNGSYSFTIKQ
jgi:methionine-rich copper-binding protein CopC